MKLDVYNVYKAFNGHVVLDDVSFHIPECKTVAFLGSSGSGKSTLLRLIGGLDCPDKGSIALNDKAMIFKEEPLLHHRRSIGQVFQAFNLFPHLTVLENIELPLCKVHGLPQKEAEERAMHFLERFKLKEHALKNPSQLSGGQRQRVAIVRAVATQSKLLLLDEPTSALDPLMTLEVLDLIAELREEGTSLILASHHMGFVQKVADWVVFVELGKILEYCPAKEFFTSPSSVRAQHFLEQWRKY